MVMVNVGFIYVSTSSCGLEGKAKTPAEKVEGMRPRILILYINIYTIDFNKNA